MQHGRLKVRTTAEQEEVRRRERAEKVRVYRETTGRIFAKVSTQYRVEVGLRNWGQSWDGSKKIVYPSNSTVCMFLERFPEPFHAVLVSKLVKPYETGRRIPHSSPLTLKY